MNKDIIGKLSILTVCGRISAMFYVRLAAVAPWWPCCFYLIWTGSMMDGCFVWRLPAWLCFTCNISVVPGGGGWITSWWWVGGSFSRVSWFL